MIFDVDNNFFLLRHTMTNFTTGLAGKAVSTIDYSLPLESIRSREYSLLETFLGISRENIFFLHQEHGDTVVLIDELPEKKNDSPINLLDSELTCGTGDAMITAQPGTVLVIRTADCVPVMLYDPGQKVLAMVHSGWRSTRLNITGKTIDLMAKTYGSDPGNMIAAIYPSIGPRSYEVQFDVAQHFTRSARPSGDRYLLDLWNEIRHQLIDAEISGESIFESKHCTFEENDRFFSHRKGDSGRNLNFAVMK